MSTVVVTGTGTYIPPAVITNEELVTAYNAYATQASIGLAEPIPLSSAEFIEKASGIHTRHVLNRAGILDPQRLSPLIPTRPNESLSVHAEMALSAARNALDAANRTAADLDGVIVACTNFQRPYPGIAVELQEALGMTRGFGADMGAACASATFGIQAAYNAIVAKQARCMLVVSPEICSGQLNFRDRDSHFIFGDGCGAIVLEAKETATHPLYEIHSTRTRTQFSNNIRCNFGFLNRLSETGEYEEFFMQEGRKVFKEVIPWVHAHIVAHLEAHGLQPENIPRYWLHQANRHMNILIAKKLFGREPTESEVPLIMDKYANTSSAGVLIAFHENHQDIVKDDWAMMCSFGAGYSAGSVLMRRV